MEKDLIEKIAKKEGIKHTELSFGFIHELEKDGQKRYIYGNSLDLNPQASAHIITDKFGTEMVLKNNGIPTLEYEILFCPKKRKNFSSREEVERKIEAFIQENGKSVIKPNNGENGILVEICNTKEEAVDIANQIFDRYPSACLSPYYEIEGEYRCIYLDGEILLVFEKIPLPGEWRHNLEFGATPKMLEDKEKEEEIKSLAIKTGKILNARFVSIDIIRASNDKNPEKKDYVLEVNSNVCLSKFAKRMEHGEQIVEEIYTKAFRKLWE